MEWHLHPKGTMPKKSKTKQTTRAEREELLERLWAVHTRKLVEKIEKTPAIELDAATFNAAAKMLAENGITVEALNKDNRAQGRSLAQQAREIILPDADAINFPAPIPPMTEECRSALRRLDET